MQRRATSRGNINPDDDEPIKQVKEKDFTKEQVMSFVNTLWLGLKLMLILFFVFAFMDNIRQKDYFLNASILSTNKILV